MHSKTEEIIGKVISKWRSDGTIINQPASQSLIEDLEDSLKIKMPKDIQSLYLTCNGTWPESDFKLRLWDIDEVIRYNKENLNDGVVFMDYGILNPFFKFRNQHEKYAILMFNEIITESLHGLLDAYLTRPLELYIFE